MQVMHVDVLLDLLGGSQLLYYTFMIYDSYIRTVDPGAKSGRQAKPHWPRHFSCIESQTVLVLRTHVVRALNTIQS